MVVCKFFLNGNCKFGANCRNEHPPSGGFASQNRFGALSNSGPTRFGGGSGADSRLDHWRITADEVRTDLSVDRSRPKWILSAYGPGRGPPASLLESNEYSPEEVRYRFYEQASQGKQDDADREAIALWNKAAQDMNNVTANAQDVIKFMQEADKKRPNRDDIVRMDGTKSRDQFLQDFATQASSSSSMNQPPPQNPFSKPPSSTFGQPSQPSRFGSSPFGQPAFGQGGIGTSTANGPAAAPFGSPSGGTTFGQASSLSAFGKPALGSTGFGQPAFGQSAQPTPGFGQTSQPASAFGQPSQASSGFGQPAFGTPGFGATPQKNSFAPASAATGFGQSTSPFGQASQLQPSSAFGQPSQPASTFGQPSQPSSFGQATQAGPAFGQPSQPTASFGQPSSFGTTAFGQPSQPRSAFGQAPPAAGSVFGQPATSSAGFGQPSQPGPSAFGQPSFGQSPAPANPFGPRPAEDQPKDEVMDSTSANPLGTPSRANPFGAAEQPSPAPSQTPAAKVIVNTSSTPHPLAGHPPHAVHYTQSLPLEPTRKNAAGQFAVYRGQRVEYADGAPCYVRPDGQGLERIWFPDAGATPDVVALNREDKIQDTQATELDYTQDIRDAYRYLFNEGGFKDGKMPLVPPMREWGVYDF